MAAIWELQHSKSHGHPSRIIHLWCVSWLLFRTRSQSCSARLFEDNKNQKKPWEAASKPSQADCEDKTCAELLFCPGETKLFMMFCTLTGIQNRLPSQWELDSPIVAEQDNVLK